VHHDAERAMICGGFCRVHMGDLRNREQGQQNEAHNRGGTGVSCAGAKTATNVCSKSAQGMNLSP
jgi:hypothetical protein